MERKGEEQDIVRVIWHQWVSTQRTQSNYQPLWQQKQRGTYRKGSAGEECCYLRLRYVFYPGKAAKGSVRFFFFSSSQTPGLVVVLFLLFFSLLVWMENVVLAEERKREGLERLDNPSDQSAIDMTSISRCEPIGFCFQHTAVCLLVGQMKTSQLKYYSTGRGASGMWSLSCLTYFS